MKAKAGENAKKARKFILNELNNRELRILILFIIRELGLRIHPRHQITQTDFRVIRTSSFIQYMQKLLTGTLRIGNWQEFYEELIISIEPVKYKLEQYYSEELGIRTDSACVHHPVYGKLYITQHALDRFFERVSAKVLIQCVTNEDANDIIGCFKESLKRSKEVTLPKEIIDERLMSNDFKSAKYLFDKQLDIRFVFQELRKMIITVERPY